MDINKSKNESKLISNVLKTKKNNRWSVFCDNEFLFAVSDEVRQKYQLYKNEKLDDKLISDVLRADELHRAKTESLRYIQTRLRSQLEMKQKLIQNDFSETAINDVTKFLIEYKFIDDEIFTKAFINSKMNIRKIGKNKLLFELYKKGIDKDVSKKILDELDLDTEISIAFEIAERKIKYIRHKEPYKIKNSLSNFLLSRGFSWDIIKKVIEKLVIN